jgi:hypothetical protein
MPWIIDTSLDRALLDVRGCLAGYETPANATKTSELTKIAEIFELNPSVGSRPRVAARDKVGRRGHLKKLRFDAGGLVTVNQTAAPTANGS